MAAADYFLKLDGVTSESADDKHKGEIEIMSLQLGETNSGRPDSAAARAPARCRLGDFTFTKRSTRPRRAVHRLLRPARTKDGNPDRPQGRRRTSRNTSSSTFDEVFVTQLPGQRRRRRRATPDSVPTDTFAINFAALE